MMFMEDQINPGNFSLYNPNSGEITKATKEECYGLERASVWEGIERVDRIKTRYLHSRSRL